MMLKLTQKSSVPSHGEFFVEFVPGEYQSSLKSIKEFKAGETMAVLNGLTKGQKAYSTVQCGQGPEDHLELNSDLVYINHSCEPNVALDLSSPDKAQWHLRALKPIQPRDTLVFFYPSTEWDMHQPFNCQCGTPSCLGVIQGAKYLPRRELLSRGFINPWILELVAGRDSKPPEKLQNGL